MGAIALNIIHVVASIEAEAAGPSHSVPALADAQARAGHCVSLFSVACAPNSDAGAAARCIRRASGVADLRYPPGPKRLVLSRLMPSPALRQGLLAAQADVIHNHGLWLMPNLHAIDAAHATGALAVLAPRGMLSPPALRFSAGKKRLMAALMQNRRLRRVGLVHATSQTEAEEVAAYGLTAPVAVIPNGVDVLPLAATETDPPFIVSVGRIHPKKALDRLIAAFASLAKARPQWRLVIAGPDEGGHAAELKRLAAELGVADRTDIAGPVYGAEKWRLYGEAALFALPTLSENFAMTVAEALAAGTPVISSKGAPWAALDGKGCGRWVDHGAEAMAAALTELTALSPAERAAMGQKGRVWMADAFSWDALARTMADAYQAHTRSLF